MVQVAFQILSDLHLETHPTYNLTIKQTAPYLALLGDIGHVANDDLFAFLERQLSRYWVVFFPLGNHEPVGTSWPVAKRRVRGFAHRMERLRTRSTIGKFVFLDQTRYDVNDTFTILGCTLYTEVKPEQVAPVGSRFIDFKQIQDWTVEDHVEAHGSDLREPQRQIIIFTHHSPTLDEKTVEPGQRDSPVISGFATDLSSEECWKNRSVVCWGFGHTHFSCDFTDPHGKRVAANQRGYARFLLSNFDAKKTFLLGREDETKTPGLI
ncbi:hypothetical protein F4677DRAFT_458006 [Hypoxylon crocopeplum]|nr:hypothetical protein F4677DRAFT_458006 [Hypoxylon crocopeplum]